MHRTADGLSPTSHFGLDSASIASSAVSSAAASVWSDAASQASDDSSFSSSGRSSDAGTPEGDLCRRRTAPVSSGAPSLCPAAAYVSARDAPLPPAHEAIAVPQGRRQHPRRTSASTRTCPPALVRQSERKVNFVDNLVDNAASIVEAIWPLSSVPCRAAAAEAGGQSVLPLRTFIQETLKRSRTSYSTLQVALYYLILIKAHVPKHDFTMEQPSEAHAVRALQCGRRMFLAALILASKYLQDRNYSARAWSKISGLNAMEINQNEMAFLLAVNWRLHVPEAIFQRWTDIVLKYTPQPPSPSSSSSPPATSSPASLAEQTAQWKSIILQLSPELDNIDLAGATAVSAAMASAKIPSLSLFSTPSTPANPPPPAPASASLAFPDGLASADATPIPRPFTPAVVMEPSPMTSYPTTKPAPALGLLPTPRLTPQSLGLSTPAVGAGCHVPSVRSAMQLALGPASVHAPYIHERWQPLASPTSAGVFAPRRSSLAHSVSVSLTSSPESMVSDNGTVSSIASTTSHPSRSSSVSSATSSIAPPCPSTTSALASCKLDVLARCRYAKLCYEQQSAAALRPVPEWPQMAASPEDYATTPSLGRSASQSIEPRAAAGALPETPGVLRSARPGLQRAGSKRLRAGSTGSVSSPDEVAALQDEVRGLLWGFSPRNDAAVAASPRKKVKASAGGPLVADADNDHGAVGLGLDLPVNGAVHASFGGPRGPGMWAGILS